MKEIIRKWQISHKVFWLLKIVVLLSTLTLIYFFLFDRKRVGNDEKYWLQFFSVTTMILYLLSCIISAYRLRLYGITEYIKEQDLIKEYPVLILILKRINFVSWASFIFSLYTLFNIPGEPGDTLWAILWRMFVFNLISVVLGNFIAKKEYENSPEEYPGYLNNITKIKPPSP